MQVKWKNFAFGKLYLFIKIPFFYVYNLSQIILSIILTKNFPFSQLHVAEFKTRSLYSYRHYYYSTIDLTCILFHQIYIYIRMKHVLFIHLFL